jgi:drug/metabolite transporter (DMT)-like permease
MDEIFSCFIISKSNGGIDVSDYILLIISVLFAVSNNALLHRHGGMNGQAKTFLFNAMVSAIWFIGLLAIRNINFTVSSTVLFFGIIYGVVQAIFQYFKMQAMANGPISVTTLIGTCSFFLSTILGIIIWSETITILQAVGLTFLILSVMICIRKNGKDDKKASVKWLLYCIGFFFASATVGIVFKFFSKSNGGDAADMMIIASFVMMITFFVLGKAKSNDGMLVEKRDILFALACGVVSCAYNRLNIYLAGVLPSIVFFPSFNGGVILLSLVTGVILFREKLSLKQYIGFSVGIVSLMVAGNIIKI